MRDFATKEDMKLSLVRVTSQIDFMAYRLTLRFALMWGALLAAVYLLVG